MACHVGALVVNDIVVLDNVISFQWTASGTSSPIRDADKTEQDPFETTGVTVLQIDNGLIISEITYYDNAAMYNVP